MITLAVAISVILVLVILVLLFRIQTLASVFTGSTQKRVGKSNKINAILLLSFLILGGAAFAWSYMSHRENILIPIASEHGVWIDDMFWLTMAILMIVFVITQVLLFWYSYKYQHKEGNRAYFLSHNNRLEVFWTVIPAIVMALLVFRGWKTWTTITNPAPADAIVVEVMGKQFNWLIRYPGADNKLGVVKHTLIDGSNEFGMDLTDKNVMDDFVTNEIHIPKGKPVLFKIRSRDVIHSFYVPYFRAQMHAVPGMPTKFWLTPTKSTADMAEETGKPDFNYELVCNQICGRGHFAMRAVIVVDEPEDYEKWVAKQKSFVESNPDLMANLKTGVPATTGPATEASEQDDAKKAEEIVREKAQL
ncbi:cytochrome c oxidase subunit II [Adhaeribacter soli]|uniref:Cytochrome c oxidase subunit 2 n=1 Tax=Adhaeribacter soli TaxID=2607655 RepID=A0A5N1IJQ0_9BACT|nr:cytochrome c oxidase subunit II [Adhaeribacter soli]KAA9325972.1 cytochrome c oxidase subunit II [Adhaeribacter soli]